MKKIILIFSLVSIMSISYSVEITKQGVLFSYEDENANCALLEKELGVAQARMKKLEATDSTERDIRNFPLGVGGFIIPPLGIINVVLLLTPLAGNVFFKR